MADIWEINPEMREFIFKNLTKKNKKQLYEKNSFYANITVTACSL